MAKDWHHDNHGANILNKRSKIGIIIIAGESMLNKSLKTGIIIIIGESMLNKRLKQWT